MSCLWRVTSCGNWETLSWQVYELLDYSDFPHHKRSWRPPSWYLPTVAARQIISKMTTLVQHTTSLFRSRKYTRIAVHNITTESGHLNKWGIRKRACRRRHLKTISEGIGWRLGREHHIYASVWPFELMFGHLSFFAFKCRQMRTYFNVQSHQSHLQHNISPSVSDTCSSCVFFNMDLGSLGIKELDHLIRNGSLSFCSGSNCGAD